MKPKLWECFPTQEYRLWIIRKECMFVGEVLPEFMERMWRG